MKNRFAVLVLALVGMPVVAVAVLALTNSFQVKELPVYGKVPEFSLIERSREKYGSDELKGKVWVANFIFTHCAGQCPLISEKMKTILKALRFKENLRLVSITVDPERDTPKVLSQYAEGFEADPYKWLFLTGDKNEIHALTQNGFRLSSGGSEEIIHSFQLVLVDHLGRIRGYYDGNDDEAVRKLLKDTRKLLKQVY